MFSMMEVCRHLIRAQESVCGFMPTKSNPKNRVRKLPKGREISTIKYNRRDSQAGFLKSRPTTGWVEISRPFRGPQTRFLVICSRQNQDKQN